MTKRESLWMNVLQTCICNMLLSSLCLAELLQSDWLEGWKGRGQIVQMLHLHHMEEKVGL